MSPVYKYTQLSSSNINLRTTGFSQVFGPGNIFFSSAKFIDMFWNVKKVEEIVLSRQFKLSSSDTSMGCFFAIALKVGN